MDDVDKRRTEQTRMEPLAKLVDERLAQLSKDEGLTLSEISDSMGFATPNYISMIRKGKSKMALTRVEEFAKHLRLDPKELFIAALKQYHSEEIIAMMQQVFADLTDQDRAVLEIAHAHLKPGENLSHDTRRELETVFRDNKPAGR